MRWMIYILTSRQLATLQGSLSSPIVNAAVIRTSSNVLEFALRTLSSISCNIPLGGVLSSIIDPLLEITGRIKVRSLVSIIPELTSVHFLAANFRQHTRSRRPSSTDRASHAYPYRNSLNLPAMGTSCRRRSGSVSDLSSSSNNFF